MWFACAVATALIWGVAELLYKKGAHPDEQYAHLKICVCVGGVMGVHALFTLLTQDIAFDPVNLLRYLPVSLLYIFSMTFSFFGMRFLEESVSDPIENTSGAICSLLCVIFLKETLSLPSVIAIGIIAVGVVGVGYLEKGRETPEKKKIGRGMAFAAFCMPFLYALLDAFGSFLDVFYLEDPISTPLVGVTEETIEQVANTCYEITFAVFALILFVFLKVRKVTFDLPKQGDKLFAAVCETAGQFTYVYAMSGNGAISAPILSSVCVVSLLLSRFFLKEKLSVKQYVFIFLVIVGILLLAVAEEL